MRRPADTSVDAQVRRASVLRAMAPEHRLALAAEMAEEVVAITRAGLRSRNPRLSDAELDDALARLLSRTPASMPHAPKSVTSAAEDHLP